MADEAVKTNSADKEAETPVEISLKDLDPRLIKQVEAAEKSIDKNPAYAIDVCSNILERRPSCADVRKVLRVAQRRKFGKGSPLATFFAKIEGSFFAGKAKNLAKKGDFKQILSEGEKLLTKCPINTPVLKVMAEAAVSLNFTNTAMDLYAAVAQAEPSNVKVLTELCRIYLKNKMADEAVRTCGYILKVDPTNNEAQAILKEAAVIKTMTNSWKEDSGSYKDALKNAGDTANLEKDSRIVSDAETLAVKVEKITEEIAKDPQNINLYKDKVAALRGLARYSEAIEIVRQARTFPMGMGDTALEKLEQDLIVADKEQQLEKINAELEKNPADASLKAKAEEISTAIRGYKLNTAISMVEKYPNDYNYKYTLGTLLFEAGQIDDAIRQFQISQRNPKVRLQSLLGLGKAFLAGRKYDMAVDQLASAKKESLTMNDSKKEIIYALATAYELMQEPQKAFAEYKEIYSSDINYRDVAKKINEFYEKKNS